MYMTSQYVFSTNDFRNFCDKLKAMKIYKQKVPTSFFRNLFFQVFETLKKQKDDAVFNKLVAVAGDVGEENLGLSEKDREILINNVDIVFHSAATLDFDQNIKIVVNINYVGTQRIIQLSSQMKRLQVNGNFSTHFL